MVTILESTVLDDDSLFRCQNRPRSVPVLAIEYAFSNEKTPSHHKNVSDIQYMGSCCLNCTDLMETL